MNANWGQLFSYINTFNNRFQPLTIQVIDQNSGTPPPPCTVAPIYSGPVLATLLDLKYNYVDSSGHNNGNVASITNNLDTDASQNFTYDSLNRIATAQTNATNQPDFQGDTGYLQECWAEQYSYDPWGNLVSIAPSSSSSYTGCTQESGFNFTGAIGTNNRIAASGYAYDSAGNLIAAPPTGTSYTYDAENRLISAGGQTYLYDGDGKRVEKASGSPLVANKLYWYGTDSNPVIETDASGNELDRYFYFAGRLVNREEANDAVDHYASDALGNIRFVYGSVGAPDRSDYYPFGGERVIQSQANNHYKFTSKERDPESGNDNFGARYYSSSLGRFMRPDDPNVDQDPANPQSWNLYSYVRNNPLNNTDPTGNACVQQSDGSFKDDKSGGQSCADAAQPQKVQVSGRPGFSFWDGLLFAARLARTVQTNGDTLASLVERIPSPPEIPDSARLAIGMATGFPEVGAAEELAALAKFSAILREAAASKGMGPGVAEAVEVTAAEAEEIGKARVGSGARLSSDGTAWVSNNGLRVYRPATLKQGTGKVQANLEQKVVSGGRPVSNFHLDIK